MGAAHIIPGASQVGGSGQSIRDRGPARVMATNPKNGMKSLMLKIVCFGLPL